MRIIPLLCCFSLLLGNHKNVAPPQPFAVAKVFFEQNATDGDVEVVFEVKGGDEGLSRLTVVSPDGRPVVEFSAPDASTMGIRSFHFESPEPQDAEGLKAAYPQGPYSFTGASTIGKRFQSEVELNHRLPATVSFVQPVPDAEDVSFTNLDIKWTSVKNMAAYILTIEQEETEISFTTKLPGNADSFSVPNGFLFANTEYKLAIGTVADNGNTSFVEMSFTTSEEQ